MVYLGSINLFYLFYAPFWNFLAKLRLARSMTIQNEPKRIMLEMERISQAGHYQKASPKTM